MTKDIHQERIGAIGAVQFFPLPIRAGPGSLRSRMHFAEPLHPLFVSANAFVRERMKVSMPAILSMSEEDAGNLPVGAFIEKPMSRCEPQTTETQFGPQAHTVRDIVNRLFDSRHTPNDRRKFSEYGCEGKQRTILF
jgi:hypothetical protein